MVDDIPAECCRVDGADGKCRVGVNIVVEDSIRKKSSGFDSVWKKTAYFPGVDLRYDC